MLDLTVILACNAGLVKAVGRLVALMNEVPFKTNYSCCALRVCKPQSTEEGSHTQADPLIYVMLSDLQLHL